MRGDRCHARAAAVAVALFLLPELAFADPWTVLDGELDVPRHAFGAGTIGEQIYAAGGVVNPGGPGNAQAALSVYDPVLDTWSEGKAMGTARHSLATVVLGTTLYAIGGHVGNSRAENEAYDATSNTWTSLASLGTARSDAGAAAFGGMVYVFGGNSGGTYQTSVERYDPLTDTWSSVGNVPTAGVDMEAVVLGATIYLVGGFRPGEQLDQLLGYDPFTNTWDETLPGMNMERSGHSVVVLNGRIYAIGGANGADGILASVESWAPGESSWRLEASLNFARAEFGAAVLGDSIYAFGGVGTGGDELGSTERLSVAPIPEPATVALVALALVVGTMARRARKRRAARP